MSLASARLPSLRDKIEAQAKAEKKAAESANKEKKTKVELLKGKKKK